MFHKKIITQSVKEEYIHLVRSLVTSFNDLNGIMLDTDHELDEIFAISYPFHLDFNELSMDVRTWEEKQTELIHDMPLPRIKSTELDEFLLTRRPLTPMEANKELEELDDTCIGNFNEEALKRVFIYDEFFFITEDIKGNYQCILDGVVHNADNIKALETLVYIAYMETVLTIKGKEVS